MTTYMGPAFDSMIPVQCASTLTASPAARMDATTNLAGARRIYVDGPAAPALRTWALSVGAKDPAAMATLHELESLRRPLRFISDSAAVNNILPPAASTGPVGWLASAGTLNQGGPMPLEDAGTAASSVDVATLGANVFSPLFPVVPGVPVSATIRLLANPSSSGRVALDWMAPTAGQGSGALSTPDSESTTTTTGPAPLLTVGATPPAGVVAARLRLTGTAQFTRPAVTWTNARQPFRPGEGAECVHLSPLSQDVITAWPNGYSHSAYQWTVTEATA